MQSCRNDLLDELSIILNFQQLFTVDLENGYAGSQLRGDDTVTPDEPSLRFAENDQISSDKRNGLCTHPTWNSTLGPMQKKQSMIRNAKTIGMLLMNLRATGEISMCLRRKGTIALQTQEPRERRYR